MNDKRVGIERRRNLRKKAEAMVVKLSPSKAIAQASEILTHELLVHRIELEIQNEELQSAIHLMELARDRYVDFYEFAPLAYITLDRAGMISEINLTGCLLLGIERFRLISRRLSNYVSAKDIDRWHRLFINIMEQKITENQAFDLEIIRADGSSFNAYLNCIRHQMLDSTLELRIAMVDISNLKKVAN